MASVEFSTVAFLRVFKSGKEHQTSGLLSTSSKISLNGWKLMPFNNISVSPDSGPLFGRISEI